jgi:hypothetical protein
MGLKCYRLWAMGQIDASVQSPTVARNSTVITSLMPGAISPRFVMATLKYGVVGMTTCRRLDSVLRLVTTKRCLCTLPTWYPPKCKR